MRFDWDWHNTSHIGRHGVTPGEAEQALTDPRRTRAAGRRVDEETRRVILGRTLAGRQLAVVFVKREGSVRVVTARPATSRERRRYRQGSK